MKSFIIINLIVALFSFHEVLYRAELHQANPSMAGVPKGESVLVHALQQVYGLTNEFATYRSAYWNSKQPYINDTNEVCSSSIQCLYDSFLVYNSLNATYACNLYGYGNYSLNATDSVSVAISQEWESFSSFRIFLVLFSIQVALCLILLIIWHQRFQSQKIIVPLISLISICSLIIIYIGVIYHTMTPFSSVPNYIMGIILMILSLFHTMKTLISLRRKTHNNFFRIN